MRLARQSACVKCHSVYQKGLGPAWKDVATKYHGAPEAPKRLYEHVTTGRKARFEDGLDTAHAARRAAIETLLRSQTSLNASKYPPRSLPAWLEEIDAFLRPAEAHAAWCTRVEKFTTKFKRATKVK